MHVYFSGIGGHAIGPLAMIAKQAGYEVSGSDKQRSLETDALQKQGITVHVGQTAEKIAAIHAKHPIDWLVYSSALSREDPDHPELVFARQQDIKHTKRDELLTKIIAEHNLKLLAVAGTHGKTTTTAMVVWLFKELGVPASYSVGSRISFGPMGMYTPGSEYFIYECDEFDRNFLAFHPYVSAITGIAWDHHEIFPTQKNYNDAFREFISQSQHTFAWRSDLATLNLETNSHIRVVDPLPGALNAIKLFGSFTRQDAWLAMLMVAFCTKTDIKILLEIINRFPGLIQRMERLTDGLYSNYAHTPEKIRGGMSAALEMAAEAKPKQKLIVIYEPLTNRRQHYIKEDYKDCFSGAAKLYWVPSYLAREDPNLPVLTPAELIPYLSDSSIAEPAVLDDSLEANIRKHMQHGDLVVAMGAAGGGSLDEWLRERFNK
jgi:UDP-N-acetylmuramate--alanine ligase